VTGSPRTHALVLLCTTAVLSLATAAARAALPPLIPRQVFFGNPVRTTPRLSPDGTRIAYLAPSEKGVLNVWVKTLGKDDDRMITRDEVRGIRTHLWAEDGRHVLYQQDVGGNENFHVYAVDLEGGEARDLTPHDGVRATNLLLDRNHPNEMLVGLNLRDRKLFDMYRVDLTTGQSTLDTENPGDVADWSADAHFVIRAATVQSQKDGSTTVRVRDDAASPWRDLVSWPAEENGAFVGFSADGRTAYATSSIGSDVTRLVSLDVADGHETGVLASDPRCDVGSIVVNDGTRRVEAAQLNYLRTEWKVVDPAVAEDFKALAAVHAGELGLVSRDDADRTWIVAYNVDNGPTAFYAWDRGAKKATLLFVNRPALEGLALASEKPVVIKARDGLALPSYLTLPVGVPGKNLPMVLYVHGGPWGRDTWGFDGTAQWLANRGYAVLQVNFRSSTGFGKKFLHLGDRQWGLTMQDDLTDAVRWAIAQGIADPKRVAIMGGSYGGYATLAGLAFTPELYTCGVDIVGPSNLRTLLASVPPYWASLRKTFAIRMGEVDRDTVFNAKVSPLFHVDRIRAPLLIGQGRNDPRVNVRESDQMVAALRARSQPVEYVVYSDEGHGFARPQNRLDFNGRAETFLAKYLHGRAEPTAIVAGNSAEVR
jgi:dipeptidyl aminopeptidase/acylaminoacyl peptidase